MRHILKSLSVAAALGLALAVAAPGSPPPAQAKGLSILVDDDGVECPTATRSTIGDAVTDIISSDSKSGTITVCAGTYAEQVNISGATSLKLIGKPGAKIVPASVGFGGPLVRVQNSASVTVQGFIIDGDNRLHDTGSSAGIRFDASGGMITNNYISNIHATVRSSACVGDGIYVADAPTPVKILKNTVYDFGCFGIVVIASPKMTVTRNLLWATTAYGGVPYGINLQVSDYSSITSNVINSDWRPALTTRFSRGIFVNGSSYVKVSGNQINRFYFGILVNASYDDSLSNNLTISANRINVASTALSIQVQADAGYPDPSSDNNKITGNTFYAPAYTAYAAIWLVASDDDPGNAPTPSLNNTTISGNKQFGFPLYGGRIVRDDSGGLTNYSTSNKTIPPPTGP